MLAATHSGTFHADDVFSFAILKAVFPGIDLIRTRNEHQLQQAQIVFDVGAVYDPTSRRFDHHMRERPLRNDETPYSSAGLLWLEYGRQFLAAVGVADSNIEAVWDSLDKGLILSIDRQDNGIGVITAGDLGSLVDAMNPQWDSQLSADELFHEAVDWAEDVLGRAVAVALSRDLARDAVRASILSAENPKIVVLPVSMPWEATIFDEGFDQVLYVIYPDKSTTGWICTAVPPQKGSFGQKVPLPEEWRGLRDERLEEVSDVPGATFCHPAGFICGAATQDAAVSLAQASIELHERRLALAGAKQG